MMNHHARRRMEPSVWLIHVLLLCSKSNAFSGGGKGDGAMPALRRLPKAKRENLDNYPQWHLAAAFMLALCQPLEPALAAPFNELPLMPSTKVTSSPGYNLPDSDAFKMLRKQPQFSGAVKELMDLQELQDSRLDACEEKGKYWEQCFMYGQNDGIDVSGGGSDRGRMDNQLVSPFGSLNPPPDVKKIPTW
mmetsp:Transcript_18346/g.39659  ORF Transcript_18346/g.39659 Transcript_18346/m.39659 type:complete len:191 (+) Transcript_18346:77-649(+)